MQINLNATLDPYALSLDGKRINTPNIKNGGSLLRLTNAGFTANYSLSSKKDDKKTNKQEQNNIDNNSDGIWGEDIATSNRMENDRDRGDQTEKLYSF